jgi:GWxTD domain-containing protein
VTTLRCFLCAALLGGAAVPAALAFSETYEQWGKGPASLLFTAAETEAWSAVATDAEAAAFARLFWARRDPDPKTPENERLAEFEQRVAVSDRQFRTEALRGALSARGRVMVLLGPPSNVIRLNPQGPGDPEVPSDEEFSPTMGRSATPTRETWIYSKQKKPAFATAKKLEVRFVPNQEGDVVFADPAETEALLAKAIAAAVTRPDLTAAEAGADIRAAAWHAAPADASTLAALRARIAAAPAAPATAPATGPAADLATPAASGPVLDAHVFQAYDGSWILPFQVSLPAAEATGQRAVVQLSHEDGSELLAYVLADSWQTAGGRSRLQGNSNLLPGEYVLSVGLLDDQGQLDWATQRSIAIPGQPAFWVSDLVLTEQIAPIGRRQELLEPYTWMSVGVAPKGDDAFPLGSTLWIYAHVCNAALDKDGRPTIDTTLELEGTKRFRGRVDMNPTQVNPRCWALGQSLELLAGTFKPGPYRLSIRVADRTSGTQLAASRAFEIRKP